MAFSKDHAIIAQNSASVAATVLSNMETASLEETLALFDSVRKHIFEGTLALADVEGFVPAAPARKTFTRGGGSNYSGGGNTDDGGAGVVMKFGKYAGRTIGDVYETDSEYIVWLSEKSNNDFLRNKATEFLSTKG